MYKSLQAHENNSINLSCRRDGSISIWSHKEKKLIFTHSNCHLSDINSIDLDDSIFVTGSRDKFVKFWTLQIENPENYTHISELYMNDRVWTTSFSEGAQYAFVGTSGCSVPPLHIIDVDRYSKTVHQHK